MASPSLVVGSTGLVGSHILTTLLASDSASAVHTISRRAPKPASPKLHSIVEADTTQWAAKLAAITPPPTTVLSALGTTRAAAGGIANQWKIDHDLNVELARAAKQAGVRHFVFVSSAGTRGLLANRVPYSQMKTGVEDSVKALEFETAIILRPAVILGRRETAQPGGDFFAGLVSGLAKVFGTGLQDMMGQEAEVIARAAVHAARMAEAGEAPEKFWVLESSDIVRMGRTEWKD
ncbi:protein FMP52, mitochondrial [Trichocladium antarcticum]|uniref:Protein FMP52, mitochondrial n=1 Tax=Trichocladium antarcticum TaxID=1450529 RepID=A0AAN6UKW4_9PEZI|nr:protein FMP52, mitochondrial [Trichocladium antarcticum]